jgi:hypothetical protein
MQNARISHERKVQALIVSVLSIIGTLAILHLIAGIFTMDFRLPISYSGDAALGFTMKGLIEGEWHPFLGIHSSRLAAPFGFTMNDYPIPDNLFMVIIKCISLFSNDYMVVINTYFVLTFVLTTLSSIYVMRHYKISTPVTMVFAFLITFLPYHFLR